LVLTDIRPNIFHYEEGHAASLYVPLTGDFLKAVMAAAGPTEAAPVVANNVPLAQPNRLRIFGLSVSDLTDDIRKQYNISNLVQGVVITDYDADLSGINSVLVPRQYHHARRNGGCDEHGQSAENGQSTLARGRHEFAGNGSGVWGTYGHNVAAAMINWRIHRRTNLALTSSGTAPYADGGFSSNLPARADCRTG
jgi:hypothetical protein